MYYENFLPIMVYAELFMMNGNPIKSKAVV
jgi:hypothetical protein